jgi:HK97 family phage prohead protease
MASSTQRERKMAFGELKSVDTETGVLTGYPATWDRDREGDQIMPGAYADSIPAYLATGGPVLLNHAHGDVLGKTTKMHEDERGVYFEAKLLPPGSSALVDNVRTWLSQGAVRGLSHAFIADQWEPFEPNDRFAELGRRIHKARFIEASIVAIPANVQAVITGYKSMCAATAAMPTPGLVDELAKTLAAALTYTKRLEATVKRQTFELALAKAGFSSVEELRAAGRFIDYAAAAGIVR